ncbi:MAG: GIY-YIG nuclease family protein [Balneolaceae bacterium]
MYYVYILYSKSIDRFYTGQTDDIGDRFIRHNQGRSKATKAGVPWLLVHVESFKTRSEAFRRETEIKSKKSRKYMIWLADFDPKDLSWNA